ncbi:MAG: hypothetical protein AAF511_02930 [Pseudomonadota bacterium]
MILRSLTEHVRTQNWFAVGLDFLIVVIGVFIGLQVQSWSNFRSERALEQIYMEQLYTEVIELQAIRSVVLKNRQTMIDNLNSAAKKIWADGPPDLTPLECFALTGSPRSNPTDTLGIVTELLNAGHLTLFTDQRVSDALQNYLLVRARARDSQLSIMAQQFDPVTEFPSLFQFKSSIAPFIERGALDQLFLSNDDLVAMIDCDEVSMLSNGEFQNILFRMVTSSTFHMLDNQRVSQALNELRQALEFSLAIPNQTANP